MKILVLNREYPPIIGGAGVVNKNLAEEWVRSGHEVDVITGYCRKAPKFEVVNGVGIYRVNTFSKKEQTNLISAGFYVSLGLLKAIQLFLKNRYDTINTHFAVLAGPVGAVVSKLFKVPNILTIIGGDIYEPSKKLSPHNNIFLKPLVRWVLNNSTEIVAISNNTRENAEKYYNPTKKIRVIPVGFKPLQFNKVNRDKLDLEGNKIYLISVGRMAPRKNFNTLLNAFSKVQNEATELLLIGDGPERKKLEELARNLNISKQVHFLGVVSEENKFQYLSAADIFVLTSVHEGFGIVYQEAMYCGLPIIAGNNGGQTEFLINNENALLVNPDSINEITEAMKIVIDDAALRNRLATNSRKNNEDYLIGNIARQYINIMK